MAKGDVEFRRLKNTMVLWLLRVVLEDEVKQKMCSLRNSFLQQLSAYNARCRSGAFAQHVAEPTWRFWKALCFLRPFIKLKDRTHLCHARIPLARQDTVMRQCIKAEERLAVTLRYLGSDQGKKKRNLQKRIICC
ncbi:hypothetical protein C0Q70_08770 [Pomacea canaliculata]|uniref:Uncharacterized protein n=1 Tax=Pomacea canaliculata TaxID=400727 RepID=A0A2T7P7Y4_POMCA|nr:hypothetical protein C0Q70_08770 [Pomacea canaliculata]